MRSPSNSSTMTSLPPTLRSRICKTLQKTVRAIFLGLLMLPVLLIVLGLVFTILFYIYSALWIGKPIEVACQNFDSIRIDCTLTHQALLRSSEQEIKDVQGIDIDYHDSSYVALLRAQSGDYPIKTYSKSNDPELEILNHRFNRFIKNSEETLIMPVHYNPWEPIIPIAFLVVMIPIGYIALILIAVLLIVSLAILGYVINFISKLIKWILKRLHFKR